MGKEGLHCEKIKRKVSRKENKFHLNLHDRTTLTKTWGWRDLQLQAMEG